MKNSKFKSFVSLFVIFLLLVSSFVLLTDKNAFATTTAVTWNPLDKGLSISLDSSQLVVTNTSGGWDDGYVRATVGKDSGKWYYEVSSPETFANYFEVGVSGEGVYPTPNSAINVPGTSFYYNSSARTNVTYGVAIDLDNRVLNVYINGSKVNSDMYNGGSNTMQSYGTIPLGTVYPIIDIYNHSSQVITANFGATDFNYPVPDGYLPYNDALISVSAPTNLIASADNAQISLSWTAASGATSYNVKRSTTVGGPYTTVSTSLTSPNYIDTSVTNGTTYYYVVTAVDINGESANSNEASATPVGSVDSNKALLRINIVNGLELEYDTTMTEVDAFVNWYNTRANGTGSASYAINKTGNLGPFKSRKDYVIFDKIQNWEVMEY